MAEGVGLVEGMHRNKLLALLDHYEARFPGEDVDRFRAFVTRQPRCFERDCWDDGHVTGSAVVLDESGDSMLMTHHAKLGRWLQLGGHADGETDPLAVACREATEESGLAVEPVCEEIFDLDIHTIPRRGEEPPHFHYDARFLLRADSSAPLRVTDESLALRWVPLGEMGTLTTEESVLRMVRKLRA